MMRQNLDRDRPFKPGVACAVDFAHTARTQRGLDFVGTKFGARGECHARANYSVRARWRGCALILSDWSAMGKLRFHLWFAATANWARGTSFTCERRAALRVDKNSSCALQIIQRTGPRLPRHRSA